MKKTSILAALLTICLLLSACGAAKTAPTADSQTDKPATTTQKPETAETTNDGSNPEVTLIAAHQSAEDESTAKAFEKFKEVIEGENVGITVTLYPAGQLVSTDRDSIEAIKLGEINMTSVADVQFAPHVDEFYVFNANYLFDDFEDAKAKLQGAPGQALKDVCEEKNNGIKVATFFGGSPRMFWNNIRPVEKLEDFSGIKMRSAENPINIAELEGLGCKPSPMNWSEIYSGLQQNTIEGMISAPPAILKQGFNDVLKYCTNTNHQFNTYIILFNQATYDAFTDAQKAAYEKAIQAATDEQWKLAAEEDAECMERLQALQDEGKMTVTMLTDEQRGPIKQAFIDATEALVVESCGQDILDVFRGR